MHYSEYQQKEMDAATAAQDDAPRARPAPVAPRKRLPQVTVPRKTDLDDEISEALYDAVCDGEGRATPYYLRHHLAERGLVIVEASRLGRMKVAIELIGSAAVELSKRMGE